MFSMNIISFTAGSIGYSLLDDGIANFLGLETLRHGTSFQNSLGIRIFGGDPRQGGKLTGSTYNVCPDPGVKDYFYLFKDSQFYQSGRIVSEPTAGLLKRFLPRIHIFFSGANSSVESKPDSSLVKKVIRGVAGIFHLAITPTLRFRAAKLDTLQLVEDPLYSGAAYRTARKVEAWCIGMLGSLIEGVNLDWFSRVAAKPLKVLTGVVQVTAALGIAALMVPALMACPLLAIPLAIGVLRA